MSRLTDLIAEAKKKDAQLGADLEREFRVLSSRLPFGLNFERHRPEAVELPQRSPRKGDKVRVLPERGSAVKGDQRLWQVARILKIGQEKAAELQLLAGPDRQICTAALHDLVVVAEFRDTIYPGLVSTGRVERGAARPFKAGVDQSRGRSRRLRMPLLPRWGALVGALSLWGLEKQKANPEELA